MRIRILFSILMLTWDPDPDPAFHFDVDPDPDPASQTDAHPYMHLIPTKFFIIFLQGVSRVTS
jgi:hypothetical protein